jgi:hypothetical protein
MLIKKLASLLAITFISSFQITLAQDSTLDVESSTETPVAANELGDELRADLLELIGSADNIDNIDEALVVQILESLDVEPTDARLEYFTNNMNVFITMMKILVNNPTGALLATNALEDSSLSGFESEVVTIATMLFPSDDTEIYLVSLGYMSQEDAQAALIAGGADITELLAATAADGTTITPLAGGTLADGTSEGGTTPSGN